MPKHGREKVIGVRARPLDGTNGLKESSVRDRLSQSQCASAGLREFRRRL